MMIRTMIRVIQFKEYIAGIQGIRQSHTLDAEGSSPSSASNLLE